MLVIQRMSLKACLCLNAYGSVRKGSLCSLEGDGRSSLAFFVVSFNHYLQSQASSMHGLAQQSLQLSKHDNRSNLPSIANSSVQL